MESAALSTLGPRLASVSSLPQLRPPLWCREGWTCSLTPSLSPSLPESDSSKFRDREKEVRGRGQSWRTGGGWSVRLSIQSWASKLVLRSPLPMGGEPSMRSSSMWVMCSLADLWFPLTAFSWGTPPPSRPYSQVGFFEGSLARLPGDPFSSWETACLCLAREYKCSFQTLALSAHLPPQLLQGSLPP